jgi:7-carboxy-7-deazaguanine synthase
LTGVPSVFIRTSGCNLRCTWCDTKYASWYPEGSDIPLPEILEKSLSYPARHCVLTGGEPMIAPDIQPLAAALHAAGKHVTIETAGTVDPAGIDCDLASISPKLSNSTPSAEALNPAWRDRHEKSRLRLPILRAWIDQYPFQLKFVVETAADIAEIGELLSAIDRPIPPAKVLVMPQGVDLPTLRGRDETLVDACLRLGYRYCNRLHIDLFGNKRGT